MHNVVSTATWWAQQNHSTGKKGEELLSFTVLATNMVCVLSCSKITTLLAGQPLECLKAPPHPVDVPEHSPVLCRCLTFQRSNF